MKLSWQLTIVIITSVVGILVMVVCLAVFADWSDGAVIGLATALGAIAVNTVIAVRNQAKTAEVLLEQDRKLDVVTAQTSGMSERERQDIAERAVTTTLRRQASQSTGFPTAN